MNHSLTNLSETVQTREWSRMEFVKMERETDSELMSALRDMLLRGAARDRELMTLRMAAQHMDINGAHIIARGALTWLESDRTSA